MIEFLTIREVNVGNFDHYVSSALNDGYSIRELLAVQNGASMVCHIAHMVKLT